MHIAARSWGGFSGLWLRGEVFFFFLGSGVLDTTFVMGGCMRSVEFGFIFFLLFLFFTLVGCPGVGCLLVRVGWNVAMKWKEKNERYILVECDIDYHSVLSKIILA